MRQHYSHGRVSRSSRGRVLVQTLLQQTVAMGAVAAAKGFSGVESAPL